jgi:hypothetical protein
MYCRDTARLRAQVRISIVECHCCNVFFICVALAAHMDVDKIAFTGSTEVSIRKRYARDAMAK